MPPHPRGTGVGGFVHNAMFKDGTLGRGWTWGLWPCQWINPCMDLQLDFCKNSFPGGDMNISYGLNDNPKYKSITLPPGESVSLLGLLAEPGWRVKGHWQERGWPQSSHAGRCAPSVDAGCAHGCENEVLSPSLHQSINSCPPLRSHTIRAYNWLGGGGWIFRWEFNDPCQPLHLGNKISGPGSQTSRSTPK